MRRIGISALASGASLKQCKHAACGIIATALICAAPPPAYAEDKASAAGQAVANPHHSAEDPGFAGTAGSAEKEAKVHGHEEGLVAEHGLTGSWGGLRDALVAHGVTIKAVYAGESAHSFSGGTLDKTGSLYHDNLDLTLSVDTGKAGLWEGGTFWLYGLRNHGNNPSAEFTGDLQTYSNISAKDQFIVNEAWYNQDFAGGSVSILAGLHNLNSEFYVSTYGTLFLNSSFGIGPEISGNVTASIFPKCALAARLRVKPTESAYAQVAVYDGDPSTRELKPEEGNMTIAEIGYAVEGSDYKIGYWRHSATKTYGDNTYDGDYGFYGIVDQRAITLDNAGHSAIGVFLQYGWTPPERNNVVGYVGAGIHIHGFIPTRDADDIGLGVAMAKTRQSTETVYELAYRLVATSWFAVRPSLQWIQNPGGDPAAQTANVGLLRFEVQL